MWTYFSFVINRSICEDAIFQKLWYPCFFENVILMRQSTVLVPNIKLADFLLYLKSLNIYVTVEALEVP